MSTTKTVFTPEMDEILRECYAGSKYASNAAGKSKKRLPGIKSSALLRRATILGLTTIRERYRWTDEEQQIVEANAQFSPEVIQRRLQAANVSPIKRTRAAIISQIHGGKFRKSLNGLNHALLCEALGISTDTMQRYRRKGLIHATKMPSLQPNPEREAFPTAPWFYSNKQIRDFIYKNPSLIVLSRVSSLWFIDLLRDGRHQAALNRHMGLQDKQRKLKPDKIMDL